jgi:hypothetical protein
VASPAVLSSTELVSVLEDIEDKMLGEVRELNAGLPICVHVSSALSCAALWQEKKRDYLMYIRFEVFTAVTMKNGVFRNVTP